MCSILEENNKMSIEELEEQIEEEWVKVRIYLIDRLFKLYGYVYQST